MTRGRTTTWIAAMLIGSTVAVGATATVAPGDRISGSLGDGDSDTLSFYVGAPSSLDLKAKLDKELRVGFRVLGPDGSELDAASALKKGLTRKPSLKGLALTQVGTYRVVIEQDAGDGEYDVQFKLGKHKARSIDMTAMPPEAPPAQLPAGAVTFDPTDTTLSATTVQDAVTELSDAADMQMLAIDDAAADIDELFAASDAAVSQRATMAGQISGLESRVGAVESAGGTESGLRVLWELDTPQTTDAEFFIYLPGTQNDDSYRVLRHEVVTLTFGPGEVERVVVARVRTTFRPDFETGQEAHRGIQPNARAVWAEIDGKERVFSAASTDADPYQFFQDGTLGLAGSSEPYTPVTRDVELFYFPTTSERTDGFTMKILYSAWRFAVDIDGFSVDIENAIVIGE